MKSSPLNSSLMESPAIWAEIDLSAIAHNVKELRRVTRPEARFMAVVKADAYGHGAAEVAEKALSSGADMLGVARINEAVHLRQAGFDVPILILGYTPPELGRQVIEWDLTQTVYSLEAAKGLSDAAVMAGKKIRVHIKCDTGMGRLGMVVFGVESAERAVRETLAVSRLPGIDAEGVFTHLAAADEKDKTFAHLQLERFRGFLARVKAEGLEFRLRHAANSAGIIELPESHFDLVRAGISMYGLYPSPDVSRDTVRLKPAMRLKARVVHVKTAEAGSTVSYGMTYRTEKPTTIATVTAGYADGISRLLSSTGEMTIRGRRAPIIGRVCMDLTMLDAGDISGIRTGDEAVLFGDPAAGEISADEIASLLGTINYEIVSRITGRVRRIHIHP